MDMLGLVIQHDETKPQKRNKSVKNKREFTKTQKRETIPQNRLAGFFHFRKL